MKLTKKIPEYALNQVLNTLEVKYCLCIQVGNNLKPLMPLVHCKDYLQDVIASLVTRKPIEIYKLKFKPSKQDVADFNRLRLILTIPKVHYKDLYKSFVKELEDKYNIPSPTTYIEDIEGIDEKYKSVCIIPAKEWLETPFALSLFTLYIRHSFYLETNCSIYDIKNIESITYEEDKFKIIKCQEQYSNILYYLFKNYSIYKKLYNVYDGENINLIHNSLGVTSFCSLIDKIIKYKNDKATIAYIKENYADIYEIIESTFKGVSYETSNNHWL